MWGELLSNHQLASVVARGSIYGDGAICGRAGREGVQLARLEGGRGGSGRPRQEPPLTPLNCLLKTFSVKRILRD